MDIAQSKYSMAFLVLPGFPMACLTSAIEPLRAANEITGTYTFSWTVVSETKQPVLSSAEVGFDPDCILETLTCDALYVLSSPVGKFVRPSQSNGCLRQLARNGTTLGAFSGGVFPLAANGLLDGKKCSVHWVYEAAFKAQYPQVEATDKVITIDGNFETASGSAAVFDLMLLHIERSLGPEIMTQVACWFQHPMIRGDDVAQRIPTPKSESTVDMLPPKVAEAVQLFSEHIEEPLRVTEIAALVNTSSRQLDRAFQRATGQSPLKYYRMVRLEKARQMVMYSSDSVGEIALAIGYSTSGPFVRQYKQAFGVTPSEDRQNANQIRSDSNAAIPAS